MEQSGGLQAFEAASAAQLSAGQGHPTLVWFDEIRALFAATGLAPEPETYELFYLHVSSADAALSRDLERLLAEGRLTADAISELRRGHVTEIATSEILALVESAQDGANRLADRLDTSHDDLQSYDAALSAGDAAIAVSQSVQELGDLVQQLRRANATMMASNRRLAADFATAANENGRLLDRLEQAERTARTDPLTGLLNRRGLMDSLKRAQARSDETGDPLSVSMVDIDHFKRINDQWGHPIGDEVLRCIGGHLASQALKKDPEAFAGRYGGEEFLVGLPGLGIREASAAIDSARAVLARQVMRRASDGASLGRISFSAGVSMHRHADTPDTLIDRADAALYAAKRAGRDRVLPELPDRR
jgi:diguanylate cyclase